MERMGKLSGRCGKMPNVADEVRRKVSECCTMAANVLDKLWQ